jgi:hypothetical protein
LIVIHHVPDRLVMRDIIAGTRHPRPRREQRGKDRQQHQAG